MADQTMWSRFQGILFPDLENAVRRFPLSMACAWVLTLHLVAGALFELDISFFSNPLHHALGLGFFGFLGWDLWRESRGLVRSGFIWHAIIGTLLIVGLFVWSGFGGWAPETFLLMIGLALSAGLAGYLSSQSTVLDYWRFSRSFVLSGIMAVAGAVIFLGGVLAINSSLEALFGASLPTDLMMEILAPIFLIGLVCTYWLANLPTRDEIAKTTGFEGADRAFLLLGRLVLLPLLVVYAGVLIAYAIKIALDQSLPDGVLGIMVPAFGVTGILTVLLLYPERDANRFLRWFYKWWFAVTLVPVALLGLAIWERYSAYGLTSERYLLCLVFMWLAGLAISFTIWRNTRDLRWIVGSFAALLVLASFGPWSMRNLPSLDQALRIKTLLEQNHLFEGGQLSLPEGKQTVQLSGADYEIITSSVRYLSGQNNLDRLGFLKDALGGVDLSSMTQSEARKQITGLFALKPGEATATLDWQEKSETIEALWNGQQQSLGAYTNLIGTVSDKFPYESSLPEGWTSELTDGVLTLTFDPSKRSVPEAGPETGEVQIYQFPITKTVLDAGEGKTLSFVDTDPVSDLRLLPLQVRIYRFDNKANVNNGQFIVLQRPATP